MSHNVVHHHVMKVAIPFDEKDKVKAAIEAANQFVGDNYDEDDPAAYMAVTMSGEALIPVRTDIVGNLMVFVRASQMNEQIAGFIAKLRRKLGDNGLTFRDCVATHNPS